MVWTKSSETWSFFNMILVRKQDITRCSYTDTNAWNLSQWLVTVRVEFPIMANCWIRWVWTRVLQAHLSNAGETGHVPCNASKHWHVKIFTAGQKRIHFKRWHSYLPDRFILEFPPGDRHVWSTLVCSPHCNFTTEVGKKCFHALTNTNHQWLTEIHIRVSFKDIIFVS